LMDISNMNCFYGCGFPPNWFTWNC
jgi:hypothetical protein